MLNQFMRAEEVARELEVSKSYAGVHAWRLLTFLARVLLPCYTDHVSAAEIDEQDMHQIIEIGVAAIVPHHTMPDRLMDEISAYVE